MMWPSGRSACGLWWPPVAASVGECIGIAGPGRCSTCNGACMVGAATATPPRGIRARRTDSSPSLISISARLDSSSRSISFLILRRSIVGLSLAWLLPPLAGEGWDGGKSEGLVFFAFQPLDRSRQRQPVAQRAETCDHAHGEVAEVTGVPERL